MLSPEIYCMCFRFFSRSDIMWPTMVAGIIENPTEMTKSKERALVA